MSDIRSSCFQSHSLNRLIFRIYNSQQLEKDFTQRLRKDQ
jgi:hypothetical protein